MPKHSPERAADPEFEDGLDADPPADAIDQPDTPNPEPPVMGDGDDAEAQRKIEQRARRMGWVPQADFRGRADTWKSAEDFVADALESNRVALERLDAIGNKLDKTEAENREIKQRLDESGQVLRSLNERFVNADRAGFERGKREAEARMRQAAENADVEGYDAAKADREAYDRATPPAAPARPAAPAAPARPTVDPVTAAWVDSNAWFKDDELSDHAIRIHRRLLAQTPYFKTPEGQRAGLDEVASEIKRRFPEHFENPRRNAAGSARAPSGDRSNGRATGRGYANLPPADKAECDKWVRSMPPKKDGTKYTAADWLAHYDWEQ